MKRKVVLMMWGLLALASCEVNDFQTFHLNESETINAKQALKNVRAHFNKNYEHTSFLTKRQYGAEDFRYELSRAYFLDKFLVIQTPVVRLLPNFNSSMDSLYREPVRTYSIVLLNSKSKIQDIGFVEEIPTRHYYTRNNTKLWYERFDGQRKIYDADGYLDKSVKINKGKVLRTRVNDDPPIEVDTLPETEVWGNYAGIDDYFYYQCLLDFYGGNGYGNNDENVEDSTATTDPTELENLENYDGGGGGGGRNEGFENTQGKKTWPGIYKQCSLDRLGKENLAYAINKYILNTKWLSKIKIYLKGKDAGFKDIKYNKDLVNPGNYNPETKVFEVRNDGDIESALGEEFIHMFQDYYYEKGISPYARARGSANIEFEAKIIMTISCYGDHDDGRCMCWGEGKKYAQEFKTWMTLMKNLYKSEQLTYEELMKGYNGHSYYDFLRDYSEANSNTPGYGPGYIKEGMQPEALKALCNPKFK